MSTPIFDPDDPRLTAYALGELPDAAERQAVEALLTASPEARAVVEETRKLSGRLEAEFANENAAYQRANLPVPLATNVIRFPGTIRRWQPAVAQVLKIAAVFLVLGALALAVTRRRPMAVVATLPPAAPEAVQEAPAPAAPSAETPAYAQGNVDAVGSAVQGGATEPETPPSDLAMDRTAQASARRAQVAEAAPGAARPVPPAAAAPPLMQAATSLEERLAPATVKVRLDDGTYVGGVVLTPDGWIMAARKLPATKDPGHATVVLADGREFAASTTAAVQNIGRSLFQIKATSLPTVKLAAAVPAKGSHLLVAHVNEHDGGTTFQRIPVEQTGEITMSTANLVFNAAGELLAMEEAPRMAKTAARAMAAPSRAKAAPLTVRPFTADERASLTHPPK